MKRLYIIIDSALSKSYGACQGGHAVAEFMLKFPGVWENHTLVFLQCNDLHKWKKEHKVTLVEFKEPDLDNRVTAMAAVGKKESFKDLPLF